jgi:hypothetical protein
LFVSAVAIAVYALDHTNAKHPPVNSIDGELAWLQMIDERANVRMHAHTFSDAVLTSLLISLISLI